MRRIKPDYPRGARERREEGDVTLELGISAEGTVDSVKIVSSCGFAELEAAAVAAAKKARFNPARQGGKAIPHSARITLQFRLK
jgi:protein TonB